MKTLDYLGDENRNWFSKLKPVEFEIDGVGHVAYLARADSFDLDLAVVEIGGDFVHYGELRGFSLKDYDGEVCGDLVRSLVDIACDYRREVGNLFYLGKMIESDVSRAY
ncbi:MAG: hypothetical protein KJ915_13820 [Candidatus Omnitrophica bacterium]|nr:hypothetical protein [Candidatus Omnitrophota bacterium]